VRLESDLPMVGQCQQLLSGQIYSLSAEQKGGRNQFYPESTL
jgi:hypothetical protein